MIAALFKLWRAQQRRTDMSILWPSCLEQAPNRQMAVGAFAIHVMNDTAWTKDFCRPALLWMLDGLANSA